MIGHKVRSSGLQNGTTCTPHPLSPLLFVLAADLLQSILNEAMHKNIVSVPIKINSCQDFPVIQYADDTVIIMPACQTQLNQIKNLLLHYSAYTGLRINYEKSIIVPINTPETKMIQLASVLGCSIGAMPFTYLGLPLCLSKPKLVDFMPVLKRVEQRLVGCSNLLSFGEKLVLIKSVFASLPIFFMSTLAMPVGIVEQLNRYLKDCFWRRYGMEDRGPALIAWSKVCSPRDQGGLGVLDLTLHNQCLLMKHLHKFFNGHDLPWVKLVWETYFEGKSLVNFQAGSFWWKSITKLVPLFKQATKCTVGSRKTILLWHDRWQDIPLRDTMPELFSFAVQQDISINEAMTHEELSDLFHTPMSLTAFQQLGQLQQLLSSIPINDQNDTWAYAWNSKDYSATSMYNFLRQGTTAPPIFMKIWKSAVMPRYKIFFWLLLHDRINTRGLLHRKNFYLPSVNCAICTLESDETILHLFWDCPFAYDCWESLGLHKFRGISAMDEILLTSDVLPKNFGLTIIIMGCWHLWMQRNGWIFQRIQPSIQSWRILLKKTSLY